MTGGARREGAGAVPPALRTSGGGPRERPSVSASGAGRGSVVVSADGV